MKNTDNKISANKYFLVRHGNPFVIKVFCGICSAKMQRIKKNIDLLSGGVGKLVLPSSIVTLLNTSIGP